LLKDSQKEPYDPWTHPTLEEFKELVLATPEDASGDENVPMEEDSEVVVNQVTMSFKCPITKQFYVCPVTSKTCNHSYSQEAVQEHIKKRLGSPPPPQVLKCLLLLFSLLQSRANGQVSRVWVASKAQ